jgi:hypothetical protein
MIQSITLILGEHHFKNKPIKEIAYHLIDYWNALYNIYPECFTDPEGFSLLQRPGMHALNRLFIDIYGLALQEGEVTEETMYNLLTRLLVARAH